MDPWTIGVFVAWVVKRGMREEARREKRDAFEKAASEQDRLQMVKEEYALNIQQATLAMCDFEEKRIGSARRIFSRTIKAAAMLSPERSAFSVSNGWFGGRSLTEAKRFVQSASATEIRASNRQMISAGTDTAMMLAQVVNLLKMAFPNLDEIDLHDIVASLPVAGADEFAESLGGFGEIGADELLGLLGLVFSGAALLKAQEEAAEIRAKAREVGANADKILEVSEQLKEVEQRSIELGEQLHAIDYQQFKLAWVSEQLMKRYPRERGLKDWHREIIDAFADHAKRYWGSLTHDAVIRKGGASNV